MDNKFINEYCGMNQNIFFEHILKYDALVSFIYAKPDRLFKRKMPLNMGS